MSCANMPWTREHLDAEAVAAKIGMPAEQVFKTLLVQGDSRGSYFAVIPGNMELDLKALAKLTGNRRHRTCSAEGGN